MVGCGVINITGQNSSYWFNGSNYAKISWTPGTTDDSIAFGPTTFASQWSSLRASGFSQIDAILAIPGYDYRAYWFSGSKYMRVEFAPDAGDKMIGSVRAISDGWPSLAKAGFDHVDAAFPVPGTPGQAYIFCGEQYCRISFTEGQTNDQLLDGPKPITTGWSVTGFKSFDTIVPRPGTSNGAYVFSGSKYCQINIVVGGYDEVVSDQRDVATYWPSLHKAGFY